MKRASRSLAPRALRRRTFPLPPFPRSPHNSLYTLPGALTFVTSIEPTMRTNRTPRVCNCSNVAAGPAPAFRYVATL